MIFVLGKPDLPYFFHRDELSPALQGNLEWSGDRAGAFDRIQAHRCESFAQLAWLPVCITSSLPRLLCCKFVVMQS